MEFTKLEGAGNDFVLIETDNIRENWSKRAVAMCDRHFGIGSDGLLLFMPSQIADVKMVMFNPDGSEAEACGNGLRCVVRYAVEKKLIKPDSSSLTIETRAGIRQAKVETKNGKIIEMQVAMGRPGLKAEEIPVTIELKSELDIKPLLSYPVAVAGRELLLYFVSMGNPHAIFFTRDAVAGFPLSQIGPVIEQAKIFPSRANFEVAKVMNRKHIEVTVWERGAGETLACGTGACAVAVAAHLLGYTDSKVAVKLPGGTLTVDWDGKGEVLLGGPAEIVFTGIWPD